MPSHEEHCQHTLKRYGVRGDDIHQYLDAPCRKYGQSHRQFRHDTKTIKLVGDIFGQKYGREMAESIALDHITADHEEEIKRSKVTLLKCPNCGGRLDESRNGQRICKYCGYEAKLLGNGDESSVRLSKTGWVVLFRENGDNTLPIALPPIELHYKPFTVDEVYSEFPDREDIQFVLHMMGYEPMTAAYFRQRGLTDNEIKKLVIESKKITIEQVKELLNRGDLILKRCVKCGKHVFERKNPYDITWGFDSHIAIVKKGVIYCFGCWNKEHPSKPFSAFPCYIATAAYGTPTANELKLLRAFRDKRLKTTHFGRTVVLFYYRTSPAIAGIISRSERMKATIRHSLNPIIRNLKRRTLGRP